MTNQEHPTTADFMEKLRQYGLVEAADTLLETIRLLYLTNGRLQQKLPESNMLVLRQLGIGWPSLTDAGKNLAREQIAIKTQADEQTIECILDAHPPRLVALFLSSAQIENDIHHLRFPENPEVDDDPVGRRLSSLSELINYHKLHRHIIKIGDDFMKAGLGAKYTDLPYRNAKWVAVFIHFPQAVAEKMSRWLSKKGITLAECEKQLELYSTLQKSPVPAFVEFLDIGINKGLLERIVNPALKEGAITPVIESDDPAFLILNPERYERTVLKPVLNELMELFLKKTETTTAPYHMEKKREVKSKNKEEIKPDIHGDDITPQPREIDKETEGIKIPIGTSDGRLIKWWPGNNASVVNLNVAIAGDMGTGKTQLTKNLVYQILKGENLNYDKKPVGFIIFDYKGDYSEINDKVFVEKTGLTVFEPSSKPMPINLFQINPQGQKEVLKKFGSLWDILQKIYNGLGAVQKDRLKKALKNAYTNKGINDDDPSTYQHTPPTIYDIFNEYEQLCEKEDSLRSILSDFVDHELFSKKAEECMAIEDLFTKTSAIKLDSLGTQTAIKDLVVTVFLNLIYERMLLMGDSVLYGDEKQYREIRTFVLVDEADNILQKEFEFLRNLLKEGRSRGFGIIMSTQYLSHYKTTNMKYYEYFRTWFIHQIPHIDEKQLKMIGFPPECRNDIKNLKKYYSLFKGDLPNAVYGAINIKDFSFLEASSK